MPLGATLLCCGWDVGLLGRQLWLLVDGATLYDSTGDLDQPCVWAGWISYPIRCSLPIQAGRGNRWLNRNDGRSEVRHVASGLVAYKLVYVAQIQETRWTADGLSC